MLIQLNNETRLIGFKFVIPSFFPFSPPLAFLDEPINQNVIEFIDYIEQGNLINFQYLQDWKQQYNQKPQEFTI